MGRMDQINAFLRQDVDETGDRAEAYRRLHKIVATEVE
ncbi:MAG: hypothetical protein AB2748_22855 [Candidatus Thiodiazotropha endolucinida]